MQKLTYSIFDEEKYIKNVNLFHFLWKKCNYYIITFFLLDIVAKTYKVKAERQGTKLQFTIITNALGVNNTLYAVAKCIAKTIWKIL